MPELLERQQLAQKQAPTMLGRVTGLPRQLAKSRPQRILQFQSQETLFEPLPTLPKAAAS
jgi:hypothetical protein